MKTISIEKKYQFYLKKVNLKESRMHPQQKKQLREAFFGAAGIMLVALREQLGRIDDEEEAIACLDDMEQQVNTFFENQIKKS